MQRKSNEIHRISVALDNKSYELLQKLANQKRATISDIIRTSLESYSEISKNDYIDIDNLIEYSQLIYGGESVIVDIELWACLLDVLNENVSDEFWKQIEKIGYEYGIHYKNKGLKDVGEALKCLEIGNWFRLKPNGGNYVLVLRTRNVEKILKVFLENLFEAFGTPVDIVEGLRKLTIINKNT